MTVSPPKTEAVFWQQPIPDLLRHLNATSSGLTSSEAADRLKQVGPHILRPPRKRHRPFNSSPGSKTPVS